MPLLNISLVALSALAPPAVELAWNAPADCPARDAVVDQIAKLANGAHTDRPLAVQASATQRADGAWSMHLVTASGERTFDASTCIELADATAVVVALMVVPPSSATAPLDPPIVKASPPADASTARYPILVRAAASAMAGPFPAPFAGAGAAVGLQIRRLRLEVEGAWGAEQQITLSGGAGARLSMPVRAGARACYAALLSPLEVEGCATVAAGALQGHGTGISISGDGGTWWLGALGGVAVAYPLVSWLWLRADVSAGYSPNQAHFAIQGVGDVARVAPWVAVGTLGVEARL